jgi:hypothetical protein
MMTPLHFYTLVLCPLPSAIGVFALMIAVIDERVNTGQK